MRKKKYGAFGIRHPEPALVNQERVDVPWWRMGRKVFVGVQDAPPENREGSVQELTSEQFSEYVVLLYEELAWLLYLQARRDLDDEEEAKDVVQWVFLSLAGMKHREGLVIHKPSAWLSTITRNRCRDLLRKRRSSSFPGPGPNDHSVGGDVEGDVASRDVTRKFLATLPPFQRSVLECGLDGMGPTDTARHLDVKVHKVRYAMLKIRKAFIRQFGKPRTTARRRKKRGSK